jgi:hypothetical protein
VFAEKPHCRRFRSFFSHFLGEGHPRSDLEVRKSVVKDTIAMKVYLLAVGCFEKSVFAGRINPHHGSDRLGLMVLDLALRAANLVLELPTGVLEGIVDSKCQISMTLVRGRRPLHIYFAAVGKNKTDMDLV